MTYNVKSFMQIIDEYLDTVEANAQTTDPNYYEIEEAYKKLYAAVKELCDNQRIIVSVQNSQNVRYKDYVPCKHCEGWGCSVCCSSQQEIMSRQGTFG